MLFTSDVVFEYNIRKGAVSQKGPLQDVNLLSDIVRNSLNADSFELVLTRTVRITKHTQIPNQKPIIIDIDSTDLCVIVADKLTYPNDVRDLLVQRYNNTFNFDKLNLPENKPVYFSGVREIEELGEINPNTGDRTTYTRRYIECRPLTDKDIIVNKDLNQIWPVATNKPPQQLLKLLKKRTELIHQR